MAHHIIGLYPGAHNCGRGGNLLTALHTLAPLVQNLVGMVPRLIDAIVVVRKVVGIGHTANYVGHIAYGGPILTIGGGVARIGALAKDINRHIGTHLVNLVTGVLHKPLYGLYLALAIAIVVVYEVLD